MPIVDLRVGEDRTCVNKDEHAPNSGRRYYKLLNMTTHRGCITCVEGEVYDPSYELVGFISEQKLLEQNFITRVMKQYPDYIDDSDKYDWRIHVGRYYPWKSTCTPEVGLGQIQAIKAI